MPKFKIGEKAIYEYGWNYPPIPVGSIVEILEIRMSDWSDRLSGYYIKSSHHPERSEFVKQSWLGKITKKKKQELYFTQLLNNL